MYKGYKVKEIVLNDYFHPETITVIDVPCGCAQCEELNEVQIGHFACGLLPESLRNDQNIYPRMERNAWYTEYVGDTDLVDEWLDNNA